MSTCNPNLRRCDLAGTAVDGCALIGNALLQIRIFVKLTEAGYRTDYFNITDDLGNVLGTNVYKEDLCAGIWYYVPYNATEIILESLGKCKFFLHKDIIELSATAIAALENTPCSIVNTGTLWRHLTDTKLTNNYYGNIEPYIINFKTRYFRMLKILLEHINIFLYQMVYLMKTLRLKQTINTLIK